MNTFVVRTIIIMLALALIAHPALARHTTGTAQVSDADAQHAETAHSRPSAVDMNRMNVAHQMMELGYAPQVALAMVHELTEHDLEVLCANPKMMQPAGAMSQTTQAILIGGLIIAGIIILAVAGNGSVSIH